MPRQPVGVWHLWQSVSCSLDRRLHLSWGGTGVQTGLSHCHIVTLSHYRCHIVTLSLSQNCWGPALIQGCHKIHLMMDQVCCEGKKSRHLCHSSMVHMMNNKMLEKICPPNLISFCYKKNRTRWQHYMWWITIGMSVHNTGINLWSFWVICCHLRSMENEIQIM